MNNTYRIMRQEIYKTLHSKGYVIFAYILPVVAVLLVAVFKNIQERRNQGEGTTANPGAQVEMAVEGYVDQSGLIQQLPENISSNRLIRLTDEEKAQEALAYGAISAYYLIPADYLERGIVYYVYPDTRSYLDDGQRWVMDWTLLVNLLGGDAELAQGVWDPVNEVFLTNLGYGPDVPAGDDCSRSGPACQSNDLVRYMPSIMVGLFFASFMASSSMLFNSIGAEKENRMLEVLMVAVSPRQLLAGKTFGLGLAGLLQMIFWLAAIYISFNLGGSSLSLPENFTFPANILLWSLVFFLGGFGLYASLMAGAGALVPNMKEAGAANYIAMIPLFLGYVFGLMAPLSETTSSPFIIFLSMFPLTSPVVMVMRLTYGTAPLWQLFLSAALLFLTAYYVIHVAAKMFHTQNLLSGESFSLKRYFRALAGQV
jgi:ABC-2 type transport system permease protein